ncbi:MAG: PAS domain S-box protein, partial [Acidimicrobiia bacterium]
MATLGELDVTVGPDVFGSATGVDTGALWRSVWESEIDAVFIGNDDGEIVAANPAACDMLGWTHDELCRLRRDQVLDMSEPGLREALTQRERTGRSHARGVLVRRDGARVPTLL